MAILFFVGLAGRITQSLLYGVVGTLSFSKAGQRQT